jgi:hypothetical protein
MHRSEQKQNGAKEKTDSNPAEVVVGRIHFSSAASSEDDGREKQEEQKVKHSSPLCSSI